MADDVAEELEEPPEAMTEEPEEPPDAAMTEELEEEPPEATTQELEEEPAPCSYLWPPALAARYERMDKLAEGMFGDVHRAWDRDTKRLVAVKRLSGRAEGGFLRTGLADLAREAMSLGACRGHPSVVELVATHADSRRGDGDCFLVTEFAGPVNLRRYLEARRDERRPFAEAEVRGAMRQLLAGAERVHGAGVLHRNMAPENVVVDQGRGGRMAYRICGFGMSESPAAWKAGRDDGGAAALASASPYRAPEVFLGARDYDGGVDTWALGCIMAELLAGDCTPFFAADESATAFEKVQHVAGTRGIVEWPGLQRLAGHDVAARLREKGAATYAGCLREVFPEELLSEDGFEVLSGLLETNPERRLTAKAALQKPWFRRRRFGFGFRGCCFAP